MKKRLVLLGAFVFFILAAAARGDGHISHASRLTNDKIEELEEEINNNQQQKKNIESSLSDIRNIRRSLLNSQNDLLQFIEELDEQLAIIEDNIDELVELIEDKEDEITEKAAELEVALDVQEAQYEAMKIRVKYMYEQGDINYVGMLLGAKNLADMLNRVDYIEMLSRYDRDKLEEFAAHSRYVALCQELLEGQREVLEEARLAVETERATTIVLIADKTEQINALVNDIAQKERAISEFEADIAEQSAIIKALEKAVAEERAALAAANARKYDGGLFAWPVPSSTRVTDEYGMRIHPILNVEQFHNGIDVGAPTGSSIVAAYQGKVIAAAYSATMGNYLMIDHGDAVYTIYMHASKLMVAEGAEVSRGQIVAQVGSTGRSTGPHLHFSVRVNGEYASPWNYLGGR